MSDTSLLAERRPQDQAPARVAAPAAFDQLRELLRNRYSAEADQDPAGAIRLRHDSAPDLLLHPDGRIEIPAGQSPKLRSSLAERPRARMSKRRTLAIVLLSVVFWLVSAWCTALIIEGM